MFDLCSLSMETQATTSIVPSRLASSNKKSIAMKHPVLPTPALQLVVQLASFFFLFHNFIMPKSLYRQFCAI